jgi:hypothetical protein
MLSRGFVLAGLLGLALVQPAAAQPAKPAKRAPAAKPAKPTPAKSTKPAACIWAATTDNTRAAMLARAPSLDAILGPITDDQAAGYAAKCGLPAGMASMVEVGQVLRARTLIDWATAELASRFMIDQAMLDAQWSGLAAVTKREFATAFTPAFMPSDAAYAGLDALRNKLKLSGDDATLVLSDYAAARAVIEGLDGA